MYYYSEQLITTRQINDYKQLLENANLTYEETELSLGIYEGEKLIGGISLDKNCIKLLKVLDEYNGLGISNVLISDIIKFAYDKGIMHLFVYTKPENEKLFNSQGFYSIIKTEDVLFLENNKHGISDYVNSLEGLKIEANRVCGIVMNLNPMTKGHEYLISKASLENDIVHVMIVREDKSVFPYEVRFKLLREVCKKYKNVIVHSGSDYCISSATFPTYFIKSKDDVPNIYAKLDINVFAKYIAKALGINVRYIGEEPYSKTTKMYNDVMKEILPKFDIEVVEVPRKSIDEDIISASKVREFIKSGEMEKAYKYLPIETVDFLKTDEGLEIIEKVKLNNKRH